MEIVIGICDDSIEQLQLMRRYLETYPLVKSYKLIESTEPGRFLALACEKVPEIVFLDVDMPGMDGIELGKRIRLINPEAVIIYVTAYERYAVEAFQVRAFHYLLKPIVREGFNDVLSQALDHIGRSRRASGQKHFIIKTKKETVRMDVREILYFEKNGHKIRVRSTSGDIHYYDNFISLLKKIDSADFIRCHQGYIVNIDRIRSYRDKTLYLQGGEALPVSRSYVAAVRDVIANRLFARGNV